MSRAWLLLLCLLALPGSAQVVPERELEISKAQFDSGNFAEALARASEALEVANFSDGQRREMLRIGGLSAFNLGDLAKARALFLALLKLDPDFVLDPFSAPPPALKLFEQVRHEHQDALALVRQQIALRVEQEKRALAERDRQRVADEERRRRLEELGRQITVRTVEKRSLLVNFVPFGAGQFQQGRVGWGVAFAVTEAVLALTSIISYFGLQSLFEPITYTWTDRLTADGTGKFSVTVNRIPATREGEAAVWRTLKVATGVGFYASWALGVGEALLHHQGEVVTETQKTAPPPPPEPVKLNLMLSPGGLGAGLTLQF